MTISKRGQGSGRKRKPEVTAGLLEGRKVAEEARKFSVVFLAEKCGIHERMAAKILSNAKLRPCADNMWACVEAVVSFYRNSSQRIDNERSADRTRKEKADANRAEREDAMAAGELCFRSDVLATFADAHAEWAGLIKRFDGMSQAAKERLGREMAKVKMAKLEAAK